MEFGLYDQTCFFLIHSYWSFEEENDLIISDMSLFFLGEGCCTLDAVLWL